MAPQAALREIHRAVQDLEAPLPPDDKFVLWFLRAFVMDNPQRAEEALLGGANDKGVDAIFIDDDAAVVYVIQGKYHQKVTTEPRDPVMSLATLGVALMSGDEHRVRTLAKTAHPALVPHLTKVRERIRHRGYRLLLKYVTTGKVTASVAADAQAILKRYREAQIEPIGATQLVRLWHDYEQGAAPPIPLVRLAVRNKEVFTCIDERTGLESHLASVEAVSLAKMYREFGVRIFARNIRGFLGLSKRSKATTKRPRDVNSQIAATLRKEPEYFWYYNNGVTMVADAATATSTQIEVQNAQIINGQQTTRVIAETAPTKAAAVLLKVIVIPRDTREQRSRYRKLISEVVKATNWQNRIRLADLQSNDDEQIRLERGLTALDYNYIRRRQTAAETHRLLPKNKRPRVTKEALAQAIAACEVDPVIAQAKDRLFDDDLYPRLFRPSRDVSNYLVFYWLSTAVRAAGKGAHARYAKWVVLNRLWSRLGDQFARPAYRDAFVRRAVHDRRFGDELAAIRRLIGMLSDVAAGAYRVARTREDDLDLSTYFKRQSTVEQFEAFLRSAKGKATRVKVNRSTDSVRGLLDDLAAPAR